MVGYIGPKAIQYNVDNSVVEGDSSIGGDLYLSGSAYTSVVQGLGDEAGLTFGGDTIAPRKNNAPADGTVDLGAADASFKDLHLSGGVYLGGTGSSNKLDDYEEGSFTPQLDTTNLVGYYTKIGNLCYFTIWGTDTNDSDNDITGLPFTASNRNYAGVITFGRSRGVDWYDPNGVPCRAYVNNGSTSITFRTNRVSGDDASFTITTNAISDWSISGVYQTT